MAAPLLAALAGCVPLLVGDAASVAASGKSMEDYGLDALSGKDCNIIEAARRADRDLCEPRGSPPTEKDFQGLAGGTEASQRRE